MNVSGIPNIAYILIFISSAFFLGLFFSTLFNKTNIINLIVLTLALFFAEYVIISGILLTFDLFYVSYALGIAFLVNIILCILRSKKIKTSLSQIDFNFKKNILIIVIVIICASFTLVKTDDIFPGYDAGVYGQKAIDMMHGGNSASTEILEYSSASNEKVKQSVIELHENQNGLYIETENLPDKLTYQYHAFPAWPAVLALWGTMFGGEKMAGVLTLLFILASLGIYFIVGKLTKNNLAKYLAALLFAFSPLAINVAKNLLTETIYISFVVAAILLLLHQEKKVKALAALPLSVLCFVHFTTLVYAPVIFIILLFADIQKKQRIHTYIGILFNITLLFSFVYAMNVSSIYTLFQLGEMFGESFTSSQLLIIAYAVVFAMLALQLAFLILDRKREKLIENIGNFLRSRYVLIFQIVLIIIIAVSFVKGYLLGFTDYYQPGLYAAQYRTYGNTGLYAILHLNIVTITISTCFVTVPYLFYKIFSKKTKYPLPVQAVMILFLYAFAVNVFLRTDSPLVYYIARYFIIFLIPAAVILVGALIQNKKAIIAFLVICVATSIPFNIVQMNEKELAGKSDILNAAVQTVPGDQVVVLDTESDGLMFSKILPTSLREINQNLVYGSDVLEEVTAMYPDKDIYFVTTQKQTDSRYREVFEGGMLHYGSLASVTGIFPLASTNDPNAKLIMYIYMISR